jgi:hypothetical protein
MIDAMFSECINTQEGFALQVSVEALEAVKQIRISLQFAYLGEHPDILAIQAIAFWNFKAHRLPPSSACGPTIIRACAAEHLRFRLPGLRSAERIANFAP